MGSSPPQNNTTTSAPTIDPALREALMGNIATGNLITSGVLPGADGKLADGSTFTPPKSLVADFTPDQTAAFDKIRGIAGNPLTASQLGGDIYGRLAGFQAPTVGADQVQSRDITNWGITAPTATAAQVADVAPMSAAQVAAPDQVASKNFTDYNLAGYTNPQMAAVIDPIKSYYDQMGDRAATAAKMDARAAGAVRGSSPQIAEALAREGIAQQAGIALSPLYQDAYKTAAGLVTSDASRDLSAQQSNQGTALTKSVTQAQLDAMAASKNLDVSADQARTNAQLTQQAGLANQDATLRAGLSNADNYMKGQLANQDASLRAGIANQGSNLQAGMANQGAAINSAGVQSNAAAGIANANQGAYGSNVAGAQLLGQSGAQQQAQQQALIDQIMKALGIRSSLVTSSLAPTTGQTQTSTTTGGGTGIAGLAGGLGGILTGLGAMGVTM